ncbi:hypothetical protein RMR16_015895 [Agrobacterium sp. rho-13.3]|uniref:hypothetical protein n=1 Tax=Agrobacterium sp. rho-13.3 TaxID=3072980 RepID=UPI002A0D2726|nr:hypothetical protein [Agrobacterium sp. rho-13.3]MDX8309171.1 hypothetical protein [Agrobacterium sp. rho-13.3]
MDMKASNIEVVEVEETDEVMALGRMVSFACQRSKEMKLEMSTYFLEMALTSLVHDIDARGAEWVNVERAEFH